MKSRPILFSGPMVRAILDGKKTQTRRVVKAQPHFDGYGVTCGLYNPVRVLRDGTEVPAPEIFGAYTHDGEWGCKCHYGQPGDEIWAKETYRFDGLDPKIAIRSQCLDEISYRADMDGDRSIDDCPWQPSTTMPRWASRITLEITGVRVERLQEISEEDAKAEGIHKPAGSQFWYADPRENVLPAITPVGGFLNLWNSIYGRPKLPHNTSSRRYARIKRWLERNPDKSWDANPWVWVIEFRRVEK